MPRAAKTTRNKGSTIEPGYVIAAVLKEGASTSRCYVGQVQAVDAQGIRLTHADWLTGSMTGFDYFIPWESLTAAMVATPEHDMGMFGEESALFQAECNAMTEGKEAMKKAREELWTLQQEARTKRR